MASDPVNHYFCHQVGAANCPNSAIDKPLVIDTNQIQTCRLMAIAYAISILKETLFLDFNGICEDQYSK